MKQQWIQCRVYPGMFSDERAVEIDGRSFFVEEKSVRRVAADHSGEVLVTIVESDGHKWAVLPTNTRESIELGA
jgi:hypothetical protein